MELTALSIAEAAHLIAERKLSPLELTQACLERIGRLDPQLNSFITVTPDIALNQAREAENAIQHGEYRGALHGIPIALKDLFSTQGVRTTAGSKMLADYIPEGDCTVVRKLYAAGIILLGKLNLHEWGWGTTNINSYSGTCKNPWNLDRLSGGSSGGAGVALAADLCLGALGGDTGGSIRIPASFCGVVGLKPTHGRVSLRGVIPLSWSLDHAGPMARRVCDVALLLTAIAGYDADDPYSVDMPTDDYPAQLEQDIRGWRVALANTEQFSEVDAQVRQAVHSAAAVFKQLGAQVSEVELAQVSEAREANRLLSAGDAIAFHRGRMQTQADDFGPDVLARLKGAEALTAAEYALARHTQAILHRQFEVFFATYDILLMPTTPVVAQPREGPPKVGAPHTSFSLFTAPFNLIGLPALSIPCGFDREGLPIGLQIVARPWAESLILRAGAAYEAATNWHLRKPTL